MSSDTPDCTEKCKNLVHTYKQINKALTDQNRQFKEDLAWYKKQVNDLNLKNHELTFKLAERKKSSPMNVQDAHELITFTAEAFAALKNIVLEGDRKLSEFNSKVVLPNLSMASTSAATSILNGTNFSSPSRTPRSANVSRIRPIIRTPNGFMQNVSISLPRIDPSVLSSATERLANSTVVSEALSDTIEPDVADQNTEIPDQESTLVDEPPRLLPRHTNELNLDQTESPLPPFDYPEDDAGLSIIPEVTEIDYSDQHETTINKVPTNNEDDESSGGEEIESHRITRQSRQSNKENKNLLSTGNMSISEASCSTPYNAANPRERQSDMKVAKVVLQQLNMDELETTTTTRTRPNSESSEQSVETETLTKKKRAGRKRKESERSVNTEDTDDEGSTSTRPKRRVTPVNLKEPSLSTKLRRP